MPSYAEMQEINRKIDMEYKAMEERRYQEQLEKIEQMGLKPFDPSEIPLERCDHPNTMEDSTATLLWIVAMIISILFKGGWVLCIIETVVWWKFVTRYSQ